MTRPPPELQWSRPREAVILICRGVTMRSALPIAALVGTVLSAVNQGSVVAAGHATAVTWVRVAVNYLVPFLVASAGWLSARRVTAPPSPRSGPLGVGGGTAGEDEERRRAQLTGPVSPATVAAVDEGPAQPPTTR